MRSTYAISTLWAFCLAAQDTPERQAAALRSLVSAAPRWHGQTTHLNLQASSPGWKIGFPSSVAMDNRGTIYVLQRDDTADPVIAVNRDGRVLRSWGKGLYQIPHAIRIDPQGHIWTVDAGNSMVFEFTPEGRKLQEISVGEQPAGKTGFTGATDIAFGPNGHLYISDGYGNARVLEYSRDGKRLRQWGSQGTGQAQFRQPHGIAIDERGVIYVADRQNGRLQRFDLEGKYLGEWDQLGMVTTVAFRDGALWIGTQPRNEPTSADGWLLQLDRTTGKILAYTESSHGHHVINMASPGHLTSGARPDTVLWFRVPER